jgi:pimeloyl-ACP methyl ester carboxylesterase
MKTDCADLVAMLEAAGGDATVLCVADGANRAVRVAADRPDLGARVVAMGAAPMSRRTFENTDAMVGSPTVVEAFLQMLEKDYRGALRTLLASTNEQMTEAELRHRVEIQVSYCPQETAIDRVRAWAEDEPVESAQRVGDRLWILAAPDVAGPWLPPYGRLRRILAELMPDANVIEGQRGEGPVSRPDVVAGLIREITGVRA